MGRKACKLVAYFRVSTAAQGESGLGLEGQRAAVDAYAKATGCVVMASFTEVESGKRDDRPELAKAIDAARRLKARLVVAKMDRLARNVHFLSGLMESGVDFVACDQPDANRLTVHILAAVAEDEAERISQRTKAALAAYKARGGLLGAALPQCRNLTDEARAKGQKAGSEATRTKAIAENEAIARLAAEWRAKDEGMTLRAIADRLNAEGYLTRNGSAWSATQVMRALNRIGIETSKAPAPAVNAD